MQGWGGVLTPVAVPRYGTCRLRVSARLLTGHWRDASRSRVPAG